MLGNMQRETANVTMQMATQQGNMIRKRLFSKYATYVESVYKAMLDIFRVNWTTSQFISVLGKEKAFESAEFKGSDIDGGFDFVSDYGASLSIDPLARRTELIQYMPLFKEAGISPKTILKHMRLNELDTLFDMAQLGSDRQREIFLEIFARQQYIPPHDMRDHKSMLEYAYIFLMSAEFKSWPLPVQDLVERHIREREELGIKQASGNLQAPGAPAESAEAMATGGSVPAAPEAGPTLAQPTGLGDLLSM
jgi:hypothetical protein